MLLVWISKKVWTSESYIRDVSFSTCQKWIGRHVFRQERMNCGHMQVSKLYIEGSHENLCQLLPVQCLQLGQLVSHLFCHLRRNIDWRRPKFLGSCIPPISCSISQLCFLFFNIMWGAAPSAWRWLLCAMWHDYLFFLVLLKKKGKWAQRAVAVWRQREMGQSYDKTYVTV